VHGAIAGRPVKRELSASILARPLEPLRQLLVLAKEVKMSSDRINPNWQDKFLGGAILASFVVIAFVAALFTLVSWDHDRTASKQEIESSHASTRPIVPSFSTN
jgi:hypothetical protein